MKYPEYVVVDTQDGTVYHKGYQGELLDLGGALEFAYNGNGALKTPTLRVYRLEAVTTDDIIAAAEQQAASRIGWDGVRADND